MREMNQISLEPTPYSVQNQATVNGPFIGRVAEVSPNVVYLSSTGGGQDWPAGEGIPLLMAFPVSRLSL